MSKWAEKAKKIDSVPMGFRVTRLERNRIAAAAKGSGMTMAEFIRHAMLLHLADGHVSVGADGRAQQNCGPLPSDFYKWPRAKRRAFQVERAKKGVKL